jgi:hypothetical protein
MENAAARPRNGTSGTNRRNRAVRVTSRAAEFNAAPRTHGPLRFPAHSVYKVSNLTLLVASRYWRGPRILPCGLG